MKKMIKFSIAVLSILAWGISTAQSTETLEEGGFGGPAFQITGLGGNLAIETGGFGGGYLTNNFYIGGGGYGVDASGEGKVYTLGYGGMFLGKEWMTAQEKLSLNFQVMGGYGGVTKKEEGIKKSDDVWIARPKAEVEFAVTNWLKVGVGSGYRLVVGSDIPAVDSQDLSSAFGSLSLRFGSFK